MAHDICMSLLVFLLVPIILPLQQVDSRPHDYVYDSCKSYTFEKAKAHIKGNTTLDFDRCVDLPSSKSFIYWTYFPSNSSVKIAYRHTAISRTKWVALAHNPTGVGMIGSQALVAHYMPNGTITTYTSPITSYTTEMAQGPLTFTVTGLSTIGFENEIIIFATLSLPDNNTILNLVWQDGPVSEEGMPLRHKMIGHNVRSAALLFLRARRSVNPLIPIGHALRPSEKTVHGILCGVAWGIMMPIGASIARHMNRSSPVWFHLHVGCQILAYILGMAGWSLGTKLGYDSHHISYPSHRHIGNTLYAFATLQVCAVLFRPDKDHKYRIHWKRYHQILGIAVLTLSFVNIYLGFSIIKLSKIWLKVYYVMLIAYVVINILVGLCKSNSQDEDDDEPKTLNAYNNVQGS